MDEIRNNQLQILIRRAKNQWTKLTSSYLHFIHPFPFQVTMSAGNGTPRGLAAGEEVWAGLGVEVEGSELPTFSAAAKV